VNAKLLHAAGLRTFALVFETGENPVHGLLDFAKQEGLVSGHFTAIGAFEAVTLGYFDWARKDYAPIAIDEQVEVLSLVGDVALEGDDPTVHAHVVVGKRDGSAHGGHLLEARVRPTLEVVLTQPPGHLRRRYDTRAKLALIDLGATESAGAARSGTPAGRAKQAGPARGPSGPSGGRGGDGADRDPAARPRHRRG
jgi:uncharacterized protein